ncbi:MAG: CHC2 zinc finger domain-containing protein [Marinosulfonomonas sp.]
MANIDFDAVRHANPLTAVVGRSVKLTRIGNEFKGLCPFHGEKTPSFTIFAGGNRFHCFGCGASGDVVDFVRMVEGVGFREAAERLDAGLIPKATTLPHLPPATSKRTAGAASRIWKQADGGDLSAVSAYLEARGITAPLPPSIRAAWLAYPRKQYEDAEWSVPDPLPVLPCMVALVQDADGKPTGIQRTYLDATKPEKANVPKTKLGLGNIIGGAVRLGPLGPSVLVTGGIEDGFSLQKMLGLPALAVTGEAMMGRLVLPDCVQAVGIGADNDKAGRLAVLGSDGPPPKKGAAEIFAEQGRAVKIYWPGEHKDWNARLMAEQEGKTT